METLLHLGMKSSGIHLPAAPMAFGESNTKTDSARSWLQEACRLAVPAALFLVAAAAVVADFAGKKKSPYRKLWQRQFQQTVRLCQQTNWLLIFPPEGLLISEALPGSGFVWKAPRTGGAGL